jgi:hypothetical protein
MDRPRVPVGRVKTTHVYMQLSLKQHAWTPLFIEKRTKYPTNPLELCCVGRMYVQWREREHEAISELVAGDPSVVAVLMQCGLLKFFLCPFMRA